MKKVYLVSGALCATMFLATGALAEMAGQEPGTSNNPKDNVPKDIQRSQPSGQDFGSGSSGPGSRSDALTGAKEKEKPQAVTKQSLEQNAEEGGGAANAAEDLKEKSTNQSKKSGKKQ